MKNFQKIMLHFSFMWVLTAIGMAIGTVTPKSWLLPISLITLGILIVSIFVRSATILTPLLYAVPLLLGITLFWSTQFYIDALGASTVLGLFVATVCIFILLGVIGAVLPDVSSWGVYLFGALVVTVAISLLFIFLPVSNLVHLILAWVVLILFVFYTIYDFNSIKHNHIEDNEVVSMALNLYLDFINLFLHILEIVYRSKD